MNRQASRQLRRRLTAVSKTAAADDLTAEMVLGQVEDSTAAQDALKKAAVQTTATGRPVLAQF